MPKCRITSEKPDIIQIDEDSNHSSAELRNKLSRCASLFQEELKDQQWHSILIMSKQDSVCQGIFNGKIKLENISQGKFDKCINKENKKGEFIAVHLAACAGGEGVTETILGDDRLSGRFEINTPMSIGNMTLTPLMYAASCGNIAINGIKELLSYKADITLSGKDDDKNIITVLDYAVESKGDLILQELQEAIKGETKSDLIRLFSKNDGYPIKLLQGAIDSHNLGVVEKILTIEVEIMGAEYLEKLLGDGWALARARDNGNLDIEYEIFKQQYNLDSLFERLDLGVSSKGNTSSKGLGCFKKLREIFYETYQDTSIPDYKAIAVAMKYVDGDDEGFSYSTDIEQYLKDTFAIQSDISIKQNYKNLFKEVVLSITQNSNIFGDIELISLYGFQNYSQYSKQIHEATEEFLWNQYFTPKGKNWLQHYKHSGKSASKIFDAEFANPSSYYKLKEIGLAKIFEMDSRNTELPVSYNSLREAIVEVGVERCFLEQPSDAILPSAPRLNTSMVEGMGLYTQLDGFVANLPVQCTQSEYLTKVYNNIKSFIDDKLAKFYQYDENDKCKLSHYTIKDGVYHINPMKQESSAGKVCIDFPESYLEMNSAIYPDIPNDCIDGCRDSVTSLTKSAKDLHLTLYHDPSFILKSFSPAFSEPGKNEGTLTNKNNSLKLSPSYEKIISFDLSIIRKYAKTQDLFFQGKSQLYTRTALQYALQNDNNSQFLQKLYEVLIDINNNLKTCDPDKINNFVTQCIEEQDSKQCLRELDGDLASIVTDFVVSDYMNYEHWYNIFTNIADGERASYTQLYKVWGTFLESIDTLRYCNIARYNISEILELPFDSPSKLHFPELRKVIQRITELGFLYTGFFGRIITDDKYIADALDYIIGIFLNLDGDILSSLFYLPNSYRLDNPNLASVIRGDESYLHSDTHRYSDLMFIDGINNHNTLFVYLSILAKCPNIDGLSLVKDLLSPRHNEWTIPQTSSMTSSDLANDLIARRDIQDSCSSIYNVLNDDDGNIGISLENRIMLSKSVVTHAFLEVWDQYKTDYRKIKYIPANKKYNNDPTQIEAMCTHKMHKLISGYKDVLSKYRDVVDIDFEWHYSALLKHSLAHYNCPSELFEDFHEMSGYQKKEDSYNRVVELICTQENDQQDCATKLKNAIEAENSESRTREINQADDILTLVFITDDL